MPELPEVETVRKGLSPIFEGARLIRIEQRRADLRFPFPKDFTDQLTGAVVTSLSRRSKYLLADMDNGLVLIMHLGMSGSFRVEEAGKKGGGGQPDAVFHHPKDKNAVHDHVVFHLEHPSTNRPRGKIIYNDPRRFGFMTLTPRAGLEDHPYFAELGVEPTGNILDGPLLMTLFTGRTAPLKSALLNQKLIAGLGNIYVCEALHRSGLSPLRKAGTLSQAEADRLAGDIRQVIAEAIEAGGSSLRDHRQTDGELGYFQHRFRVYDREGAPCPTHGCNGVIERFAQSGRSSFHCPLCQG